jgi:CubicO group peptidase (beta-lactamase class C family)
MIPPIPGGIRNSPGSFRLLAILALIILFHSPGCGLHRGIPGSSISGSEGNGQSGAEGSVSSGTDTVSAKAVVGNLELAKLDRYIEEARIEWHVPGISVAIVKDDSVVFAQGYGLREYGKPAKVDEYTLFSAASITKTFTSTALGMLVDEGKIGWDDRVRDHLPDFSLYDPWVSNEIRIRDLLCHRSGLETFSGDLLWFNTSYDRKEILRRLRHLEPEYGFRSHFGYSNLMYLAAGEVISTVSGMSWEEFIEQRILITLGMEASILSLEDADGHTNLAMPHHVDLSGDTTHVLLHWDLHNIAPAMALNSSAMDLSRWVRFHLGMGAREDEQLLSRENVWEARKMHTPKPVDMGSQRIWPSTHFRGYGLGWEFYDYHGWKVITHEGATNGMLGRLVIVPDENFGFIILSNSINAMAIGLEYYILDQYYQGKSYDWCHIYLESSLMGIEYLKQSWDEYVSAADRSLEPSLELNKYTGVYGGDLYGNVEVGMEKGSLYLDFLPAPGMYGDFEQFSRDTFLITIRDEPFLPQGTVKFLLNEQGDVEEMIMDIPSPDFDFSELELKKLNE